MENLFNSVRNDIEAFLKQKRVLPFCNEREFQMQLAVYLYQNQKYTNVYVEYFIPCKLLTGYPWKSDLRIDIIVESGNLFVPVELKYVTKMLKLSECPERLGQTFSDINDIPYLRQQGAYPLHRYHFWKDVCRLEYLKNRFDRVAGGLVVFVTNDKHYEEVPHNTIDQNFGMAGMCQKDKYWHYVDSQPKLAKYPAFRLENEYNILWKKCSGLGENFIYCMAEVTSNNPI